MSFRHISLGDQNDLLSTILFFIHSSHPIIGLFYTRNSMMSGRLNWEMWNRTRGPRHLMAGYVFLHKQFIIFKANKCQLRQSV